LCNYATTFLRNPPGNERTLTTVGQNWPSWSTRFLDFTALSHSFEKKSSSNNWKLKLDYVQKGRKSCNAGSIDWDLAYGLGLGLVRCQA